MPIPPQPIRATAELVGSARGGCGRRDGEAAAPTAEYFRNERRVGDGMGEVSRL